MSWLHVDGRTVDPVPSRHLPGSEIGECVAVAKRKGARWFVAVENASRPAAAMSPC